MAAAAAAAATTDITRIITGLVTLNTPNTAVFYRAYSLRVICKPNSKLQFHPFQLNDGAAKLRNGNWSH